MLSVAALVALTASAEASPRDLTYHNKTGKVHTQPKKNKVKTKEVTLCLPCDFDYQTLPIYKKGGRYSNGGYHKEVGGNVFFWSPLYDCHDDHEVC